MNKNKIKREVKSRLMIVKLSIKSIYCFFVGHKSTSNFFWDCCDRCGYIAPEETVKGEYVGENRVTKWRGHL